MNVRTFLISLLWIVCLSYKPIIFLHGFDGTYQDFDNYKQFLSKYHPGTQSFSLHFYPKIASRTEISTQVPFVISKIQQIKSENNITSFHLISHSQGALIGRAVLQMMNNHEVDRYISLSGMHYGWYGIGKGTIFVPKFLLNKTLSEISDILYTKLMQKEFSLSNYWRDPMKIKKYYDYCSFFTKLNNQTFNELSFQYKKNFLSTNLTNFFGGKDDGVISPWQSAVFGFYKNGDMNKMLEMKDQDVYQLDSFGLKTMDMEDRLRIHSIPGYTHDDWIQNETFFKTYVLPLLV